MAHRRLRRDIAELAEGKDGIILDDASDIFNVHVMVAGLEGSSFEGGLFKVKIEVPIGFPSSPPKFFFNTKVFHPNICRYDGEVCVDILKDKWAPSITLHCACKAMQALLSDPYEGSPLNLTAAKMIRRDRSLYEQTVKVWTEVHAGGTSATQEHREAVDIVSAIVGSRERALLLLTLSQWDIQKACDSDASDR